MATNSSRPNSYRAVIFDLGGVVLGSPLHAIKAFEARHAIPNNTINRHVASSAPDGAWHRLERGELAVGADFFAAFDEELAQLGFPVSTKEMMANIKDISKPRPEMIDAIRALRRNGLKVAALTNNWNESSTSEQEQDRANGYSKHELRQNFDLFLESAILGMRKPDPRIYDHTCRQLNVKPEESIFLDDIGTNLKSARSFGMKTIKVDDPAVALAELRTTLKLDDSWQPQP